MSTATAIPAVCPTGKHQHRTRAAAARHLGQHGDPDLHSYRCPSCLHWHVGHAPGTAASKAARDRHRQSVEAERLVAAGWPLTPNGEPMSAIPATRHIPTRNGVTTAAAARATITFEGRTLTLEIVRITPELAAAWLLLNRKNRRLNRRTTQKYARIMAEGGWMLNGEGIVFDETGALINGQHRLQSCLDSGKPFVTLVVRGVDPAAFKVFDRPKSRTSADVLHIDGEVNTSILASVLMWLWRYEQDSMLSGPPPEPSERLEVLGRHPGIRAAIRRGSTCAHLLSPHIAAFCFYLFNRIDPDAADRFMVQVAEGTGLQATDPAYLLRRRMIESKGRREGAPGRDLIALWFKAWNMHRAGKGGRILAYKSSEPFPVIE
jgi:hypothetical protein